MREMSTSFADAVLADRVARALIDDDARTWSIRSHHGKHRLTVPETHTG